MAVQVDIFIRVRTWDKNKYSAIVLYRFKGVKKEQYFSVLEDTQYRCLMIAAKTALEGLKVRNCKVKLYTQTNFGFKYLKKLMKKKSARKWVNKDLGELLVKSINKGGHTVKFMDCSEIEGGRSYQAWLEKRLTYVLWKKRLPRF